MAASIKNNSLKEIVFEMDNGRKPPKAKFEAFGEEMIEKEVKKSGNNGRVYLPPEWVGKRVRIIRID